MGSIQLLLEDPSYSAALDQNFPKISCIYRLLEDLVILRLGIRNCPKIWAVLHLLLEDPCYSATWDPKLSRYPTLYAI